MPRSLLVNASPDFIGELSARETIEFRVARHGLDSNPGSEVLGDPSAYAVVLHLCVSGASSTPAVTSLGDDGTLTRPPVVPDLFLSNFSENNGFSVYFIDYFNHEIQGHPDSFRLSQLEPHEASGFKVNSNLGGEAWNRFADSYGKYIGRLFLKVVKKTRAKVLIARPSGQPVVLLAGSNTLIMPAPLDLKALPGIVSFLLDDGLSDLVPALSNSSQKSSRLLALERALTDEVARHDGTIASLQLEIEAERQAIDRTARLATLHDQSLLNVMSDLLSEHFEISTIDLSPVVGRPAFLTQPGNVAVFTSRSQNAPDDSDFVDLIQRIEQIRQTGVELRAATILFNRSNQDEGSSNLGLNSSALAQYTLQTGINFVSGEEVVKLIDGAREGQINATDLINFISGSSGTNGSNGDNQADLFGNAA